jgi:enterochelin esterase family protein
MKKHPLWLLSSATTTLVILVCLPETRAQPAGAETNAPPARGGGRGGAPRPAPVEVSTNGLITFRLAAPNAQSVRVSASDIPGTGSGVVLVKNTNNIWEGTVGAIPPGAYRYNFSVDGLSVVAPRNPGTTDTATTSESNDAIWSIFTIPGSDLMDTRNVPHGAVETVTYFSKALNRFRRMHVYTPPGYEKGSGRYPVFYLLHGAGDSDDAWSTVGRAGFIMDNLIADHKAKPMVVVMPAGHTAAQGRRGGAGGVGAGAAGPARDEFQEDFLGDVMPYAESHYRVYTDQRRRAIAGLSMGGGQTLNAAFATLNKFAYIGVFSSGIGLGGRGAGAGAKWEAAHKDVLDNPKLKKNIKLIWMSTGKDDNLITTSRSTVELLKKHGFNPVFIESSGAHTWINWRDYLGEFAPQLFK